MKKIIKNLPENYILSYPVEKDTKNFFYIGTSDSISNARKNIYKGYGIDTLICDSEKVQILKIGITNNLEIRLNLHNKDIPDFRYLKTWKIKYPKTLETSILDRHYKDGFSSFGREWFWDINSSCNEFLKEIDWEIENTYKIDGKGFSLLYK